MRKKIVKTVQQEKKETLILLREKDRRALKDVGQLLESEIDKEIAWRMDPNRYETSDSIINTIYKVLNRIEGRLKKQDEVMVEDATDSTQQGTSSTSGDTSGATLKGTGNVQPVTGSTSGDTQQGTSSTSGDTQQGTSSTQPVTVEEGAECLL